MCCLCSQRLEVATEYRPYVYTLYTHFDVGRRVQWFQMFGGSISILRSCKGKQKKGSYRRKMSAAKHLRMLSQLRNHQHDGFFSCLLPPPLIPTGWLFWMRLDLLTLVFIGAPGSWPGLMGLAGFGYREAIQVTHRAKAEVLLSGQRHTLFRVFIQLSFLQVYIKI